MKTFTFETSLLIIIVYKKKGKTFVFYVPKKTLVSAVAGGTTSSGDGGGSLSCLLMWGVVCWEEFLDLIIKLWLMFRSRHLVLWSLGTYGLRESG